MTDQLLRRVTARRRVLVLPVLALAVAATGCSASAVPRPPIGCGTALTAINGLPAFPPTSYDAGTDVSMMNTAVSETSRTQAAPVVQLLAYYAAFFNAEVDPLTSSSGTPVPADLRAWNSETSALRAWCSGSGSAVAADARSEDAALSAHLGTLESRYLLTQTQAVDLATAAGVTVRALASHGESANAVMARIEAYADANISGGSSLLNARRSVNT